jgi:hypothetical protein
LPPDLPLIQPEIEKVKRRKKEKVIYFWGLAPPLPE